MVRERSFVISEKQTTPCLEALIVFKLWGMHNVEIVVIVPSHLFHPGRFSLRIIAE